MAEALATEVQTYQMGSISIPYIEVGSPDDRPPLVLFNGISMDESHWGQLPTALDRHVFAVGFPGGGRTILPTIQHYARQMEEAVPEIVGGDEFDELGLSWGGLLVQGVRQGVRKRVIAASLPAAPSLCVYPNIPDGKALRIVMSTRRDPEDAGNLYGGDIRENPDIIKFLPIDRQIKFARHMKQQFAAMTSGYLVLKNMLDMKLPETLVMAGTDDPLMRYSTVRIAARSIGAELATIKDGGHGFLLTRPEESAAIINEFLDRP